MISIILPVYNSEKYIKETLESILNQNYKDFELIIIDDGSKDSSKEIIRSFTDSRIKYYYQENQGVSSARNKGLDLATGNFVVFHDSDDISLPSRLETQIKQFDDFGIGAVHTDMMLIDEENKPIGYWQSRNIQRDRLLRYFLKIGTPFNNGSMMFRREIIGNNRYDSRFRIGEDTNFIYEVVKSTNTAHISEPLLLYRRHSGSASSKNNYDELFAHVRSFINNLPLNELLPELDWDKHPQEFNLIRAKVIIAYYLIRRGMAADAEKWLNEAIKTLENNNDINIKNFVLGMGNLILNSLNNSLNFLLSIEKKDHIDENYIGEVYAHIGDIKKAAIHFSNALKIYPQYIDAIENLKSLGASQDYNIIDISWRKFTK